MSGHSKWATTHRQKETADKKRSASFTRLARALTLAAREAGSNPESNFKLRLAIEKAKQGNMPKDNIERAIKRGTGELTGESIEETIYEAVGPENTALIIKVLTDNKNRTTAEIKNILNKNDAKLTGPKAVSWMFEQKGVIRISNTKSQIKNLEEFELSLIELGIKDIKEENNNLLTIYTQPEDLQKIKEKTEKINPKIYSGEELGEIKIDSAEIEYLSKKENQIKIKDKEKITKLLNSLKECDAVEEIYTNIANN